MLHLNKTRNQYQDKNFKPILNKVGIIYNQSLIRIQKKMVMIVMMRLNLKKTVWLLEILMRVITKLKTTCLNMVKVIIKRIQVKNQRQVELVLLSTR